MKTPFHESSETDGTLTSRILDKIRFQIFLSDLTQRQVESRVGFSSGYLSQLLSGEVEMKYWQLLAILRAMDLEPSDFFAELYPRRRHPALDELDRDRRRVRQKPLARELARLFAFGIESILDLYERLERCESALDDLVDLGVLQPPESGKR